MPDATTNWDSAIGLEPDPVIVALEQQVACYRNLAKLAQIQHEHVQQDATEALLEVLGQRKVLVEAIAALEATIAPALKRWGDYLSSLRTDQRGLAERLLAETRRLLEEITLADRNDTLVLQQRKLNLGRQIQSASAARQVNRNYATAAYGRTAARVDVKQ